MLRLSTIIALAGLSLAVIQPMGVAGARINSSTPESVMHIRQVGSGSGPGMTHGAAKFARSPATAQAATCQSGQYLTNGSCTNCPQGYYCTGGTAQPTACSAGTYNDQPSASGSGSCKTVQCGYKPSGGNSDGTAATGQTACGVGYYSKAGSTTCTVCPAGMYCNAQTTCSPTPCDPGTYAPSTGSGQSCANCPAGTFNNSYGNTSCCSCCAGWYNQGSNTHTNCQQCPNIGSVQSSGVTGPVGSSDPNNCQVYNGSSGQSAPAQSCSQTQTQTPGTCPATTGSVSSKGMSRRDVQTCPFGMTRCEVKYGRGGFECIDTKSSLETCGGCDNDCSTMAGTNEVGCVKGHCVIKSCMRGYALTTRGDGVSRGGLDVGQHCVAVKKRSVHTRHSSTML